MEQVQPDTFSELVQSRLEKAKGALNDNDLNKAWTHLDRVLEIDPKLRPDIQHMLKDYCSRISDQDAPDWDCIHTALGFLAGPKLVDEQTQAWQQEFKLKEARFWLAHEDQNKTFDIFAELMDKAPASDQAKQISDMVRDHVAQHLSEHSWPFLGDVVGRLHSIWPPGELHDWLETTSNILAAAAQHEEQLRQAAAAQQEDKLHRYRNLSYALLIGIAVTIVLALALVLIVR